MSVVIWLVSRWLLHISGGRLAVDWCTAVLPHVESTQAYPHGSLEFPSVRKRGSLTALVHFKALFA